MEYLKPYKDVVGFAAGTVTIIQLIAPAFLIRDIIRDKHTRNCDPIPFIGGFILSSLFLINGYIIKDTTMAYVNLGAVFLGLLYIWFYYQYTEDKESVLFKFYAACLLVLLLILYCNIEDENVLQVRFGFITTVFLLAFVASPLIHLGEIIRKQDASSLPIPIIIIGTVVSFLWLVYGKIIENDILQIQNTIALVLSGTQLALYAKYRYFTYRPVLQKQEGSTTQQVSNQLGKSGKAK